MRCTCLQMFVKSDCRNTRKPKHYKLLHRIHLSPQILKVRGYFRSDRFCCKESLTFVVDSVGHWPMRMMPLVPFVSPRLLSVCLCRPVSRFVSLAPFPCPCDISNWHLHLAFSDWPFLYLSIWPRQETLDRSQSIGGALHSGFSVETILANSVAWYQ